MADEDVKNAFDKIINHYLDPHAVISKEDIHCLINNTCKNDKAGNLLCYHYKIINNELYFCNDGGLLCERIEAFKHMLLETLKTYKIKDCEFVIYDNDGINDSNINKCIDNNNNKLLPLIVTTSVLHSYNMILCPDFTFSFSYLYHVDNHENMCKNIVDMNENVDFKTKINKMVYRGSGNKYYRQKYMFTDKTYFDIESVLQNNGKYIGDSNYMSREEKSKYKYYLHLNGHEGNNIDGAYSSALKWGLMNKSVVFYSAPTYYREFWQHPLIFKESEHFVYSKSPEELLQQYKYYINNPDSSEKIANQSFEFFKKYLMKYENITYYMQKLLNEYANRMNYVPELSGKLITSAISYDSYYNRKPVNS
jgi:hypothetical protein